MQNNGTQGTPDHGCSGGFCLGDYPHIGADAHAIFLTTNEFALFGSGFYGAQIYAISKQALASGAASPNVVLFNGGDPSVPAPAFTVWPAISSGGQYVDTLGGTEYLLSSDAVFYDSGISNTIWLWSVSNTQAIDTAPTTLVLGVSPLTVQTYAVPSSLAQQKPGSAPLRDCFALAGCAPTYLGYPNIVYPTPRPMAVNDSRMQQVSYANGKLWGTLDAAAGAGPWDGFTGIPYLAGDRPRWGDYGAAAADGNTIWTASEYIAHSCTLAEYLTAPLFQCGGTRAALGNWATRISAIGL